MKNLTLTNRNGNTSKDQQIAIENWNGNNCIVFLSYNTIICIFDTVTNKIYFTGYWNYSATTKRWLNCFLSGFCGLEFDGVAKMRKFLDKNLKPYNEFTNHWYNYYTL